MNTRIGISIISIVSALALLSGATFAFFSDQATSNGNTFSTGNADLQIAADVEGTEVFTDSITGPNFSGLFPGETREFDFWLKNNSLSAIDLNLVADVSAINPTDDATQEIDNALLISWVCDTDGNGGVADNTPTAEFSPRAWLNGGNASLESLTPGEQMICRMFGRLPDTTDNTVAGETVIFDVTYDGTQTP